MTMHVQSAKIGSAHVLCYREVDPPKKCRVAQVLPCSMAYLPIRAILRVSVTENEHAAILSNWQNHYYTLFLAINNKLEGPHNLTTPNQPSDQTGVQLVITSLLALYKYWWILN